MFVDALLGNFGTKERRIWVRGSGFRMSSNVMPWHRLLSVVMRSATLQSGSGLALSRSVHVEGTVFAVATVESRGF